MGFDPEFQQHLNNRYEEELPLDSLQDMTFEANDGGVGGLDNIEHMDTTGVTSGPTAPIPIPTSKQPDAAMPDAAPVPGLHFGATDRTGL